MQEDREYSAGEIAGILGKGIGVEALESWPLTALPEYVIGVARVEAAVEGGGDFGQLDEALRPRPALRTQWGMLVVDHYRDCDEHTVAILGYLQADPYLELPHVRKEGERVGIHLSDLIFEELLKTADQSLLAYGLDWADNDDTRQVFCLIGVDEPGDPLPFVEAWESARPLARGRRDRETGGGLPEAGLSAQGRLVFGLANIAAASPLSRCRQPRSQVRDPSRSMSLPSGARLQGAMGVVTRDTRCELGNLS